MPVEPAKRPTVERSTQRNLVWHVATCALLTLLVAGIQIQGLWQGRQQVEERTKLTARDLGNVLTANIVGAFRNIDIVLLAAIDQIRLRPPVAGVADPALLNALEDLHRRTPGLIGLHATDASGLVQYGTGREIAKDLSIGDRDYFQKLKANLDSGMVVSSPVMGKIDRKWVLVCARRIDLPGGQFGGVIYGSVEIEGMAERISGSPLQLGEQDIVALSDDNMSLIVRYIDKHQDMRFVGQKRSTPVVDRLLAVGADDGFFSAQSPIDEVERIFYFQHMVGLRMNLIVGLATSDALASWRREATYAAITTLMFALITSFASYLIYQGQIRKLRLVAELAESNQRLSDLSTTDGLTRIANRRRFDEVLEEEWRRAVRNRQSLALAMVDVDYFKTYNDRYGHQRGDECLRGVAQILSQNVRRAGDFVARYGGEEFVVMCVATDGEHARRLVDGMRASLQRLAILHESSPIGCVTISIGVAAFVPNEGQGRDILVRKADEALYAAKEQGRNRVVLAS